MIDLFRASFVPSSGLIQTLAAQRATTGRLKPSVGLGAEPAENEQAQSKLWPPLFIIHRPVIFK